MVPLCGGCSVIYAPTAESEPTAAVARWLLPPGPDLGNLKAGGELCPFNAVRSINAAHKEDIKKMMNEQQETLTLWMLNVSNNFSGALTHVYARDVAHAREQTKGWIENQHLPQLSIKAYPNGFRVLSQFLPGTISVRNDNEGVPPDEQ